MGAPCEWPVIWPDACRELDPVRAERTAAFVSAATDLLWNWTGRVFGACPVTVELVHDPLACACSGRFAPSTWEGRGPVVGSVLAWRPVLVGGRMFNVTCGCGLDRCSCGAGVQLPGPVAGVTSVTVDGVQLPEEEWRLDGTRLYRADGDPWPHEGLRVEYRRGVDVPPGGQLAAGVLAWELSKSVDCPDDCALPQRLTAVTRQGVSVAIMDQFEDLSEGRTGIWLIDSWVASVTRPRVGGSVLSPDLFCAPVGDRWKAVGAP